MWPLRRKPAIDPETADWISDNLLWLFKHFHRHAATPARGFILPKTGFFPTEGQTGHDLAERIFEQAKLYCGLSGDTILLTTHEDDDETFPSGVGMASQPRKSAAGLYWAGDMDNAPTVSYSASLLHEPGTFIATLAHELAHHVLARGAAEPAPCDDDEEEFLTDLTAVFMGYGVFLARARFVHWSVHDLGGGWSGSGWRQLGYLPEQDLLYASAMLACVLDLDVTAITSLLASHQIKPFLRAAQEIKTQRGAELSRMRAHLRPSRS
jgi:hypothetical protein